MSFFEELTKKATGLLADVRQSSQQVGGAGDLSGEAAMPDQYGQPAAQLKSFPSYQRTESPIKGMIPTGFNIKDTKKTGNSLPNSRDAMKVTNELGISNDQAKNFFGLDLNQIKSNWKDKGGFEGLMSNPGFTLGLAIMQSSAQGRPISESLLQNVLASGEVSSAYTDRIKARSKVLAPVSEDQRNEVAAVLAEDNYYEPDFLDKMAKGNQSAKYREALDDIYDRANKIAKSEAKGGKEVRFSRRHIRQAIKDLEASGKLKKKDPSFFGLRGGTVEATGGIDGALIDGGQVEAGKDYIVGEGGPEVFTPNESGKVTSNDDTQVIDMLLNANPALQNMSRNRAEKILRNRFPDYFN
jgi:hypothetical protein